MNWVGKKNNRHPSTYNTVGMFTPFLPISINLFQKINSVNFLHNPICFGEGDDHFLIVPNIVEIQAAAMPVFEPLLGGLVSADIKFPGDFGKPVKILHFVNPHPTGLLRCIRNFIILLADFARNRVVAVLRISGDKLLHLRMFPMLRGSNREEKKQNTGKATFPNPFPPSLSKL